METAKARMETWAALGLTIANNDLTASLSAKLRKASPEALLAVLAQTSAARRWCCS